MVFLPLVDYNGMLTCGGFYGQLPRNALFALYVNYGSWHPLIALVWLILRAALQTSHPDRDQLSLSMFLISCTFSLMCSSSLLILHVNIRHLPIKLRFILHFHSVGYKTDYLLWRALIGGYEFEC